MAKVIAFTKRNQRSPPGCAMRDNAGTDFASVIDLKERVAVRSRTSSGTSESEILVSVVVATSDRPHLLSHCLASLLWQRFDAARYEIIVVDDRPNSCTRDIVADWALHAKRTGTKVIYLPSSGPHGTAAARNRGWRAARGEVIAFTNDDTAARTDWLRNGWDTFEQDVQAVWGRVVVPCSTSPDDYERRRKNQEHIEFPGANCFCRKQALEELGGFDERFALAWREDADLYFRLLNRAGRIVHAPSAVMTHPIRPPAWGESLREQRRMQADALLYKKHPALYRQKIRSAHHWDCYLIVAALLSFLAALAYHQPVAAIAAAATWVFLTAWFGFQHFAPVARTAADIAEMMVASVLVPPLAIFWRLIGAARFRVPFL